MILTEITKVFVHIHRSCMKNMVKLEQSNLRLQGMTEIFLVRPDDVDAYLEEFKPMQLREKRTVKVNDRYAVINMGEAKGLTYDRVLIYPTGTMRSWMKDHSKTLQPKTKSQFYVAITRARYSVGIVFDYDEKISIEGVEKYQ